jgi:NTE family protein
MLRYEIGVFGEDVAARYLNLVFQGGGVRGVAYAGVLEYLPPDISIHGVGGTSAGAIVAALLAIGKPASELKAILSDRELLGLVSASELQRTGRLRARMEQLRQELNPETGIFKGLRLAYRYRDLIPSLAGPWQAQGLHSSAAIRTWLDRLFGGQTFGDIKVADLKIVTADVSKRRYLIYDAGRFRGTQIAESVHASISIPAFFSPLKLGPRYLVDGGILSNFPNFLFAQSSYPTIGFRLSDVTPAENIDSTAAYLKNLLLTMVEAHDAEREDPPYFRFVHSKRPKEHT